MDNWLRQTLGLCVATVLLYALYRAIRWAAADGRVRGIPGWLAAVVVVWFFPLGTVLWFALRPAKLPPPSPVGLKFYPPDKPLSPIRKGSDS